MAHDGAVDVAPIHILTQVEGPDRSVLVVLPALGDGGHRLAVVVGAQQAVHAVGQHVEVGGALGVQHVPALHFTHAQLPGVHLAQRCAAVAGGGAEAAPDVAVLPEELLEPPQAASRPAAPTAPAPFRNVRRLMAWGS